MRSAMALLAILLLACGPATQLESEDSLRARFEKNEAVFDHLLALFAEDSHLVRVGPEFTRLTNDWSWPRKDVGLSPDRWDLYRRLFNEAGITSGLERQGDQVLFYMSSVGLAVSRVSRGVAYTESPPVPIVTQLGARVGEGIVYVPLHDRWYLFDWAS